MSSSNYDDDAASTSTTDYASTISERSRARRQPPRQEDRPRSGVLRTVGDPNLTPKPDLIVGDTHYDPQPKKQEITTDLPTVDFGPTYALTPEMGRPGTSGTMTQALHEATRSKEKLGDLSSDPKRESLLTGRTSPGFMGHIRASSNSPDFAQASDARTIAWQPGMGAAPGAHDTREKLDPEDWVQQRANAAVQPRASPVFGHNRNKSSLTPPMSRQVSGDWTNFQPTHQRTPTGESMPFRPPSRPLSQPLSRPQSRGAGNVLISEKPTQLSAREQQQVAKMTGTPLIDLGQNNKKDQHPASAGLVGYVGQREKQKLLAKQNSTTPAMQAEIDRRMRQQQQQQQMQMPMQGGYSGTPSIMNMPLQNFSQPFIYNASPTIQSQQPGYFPPQTPMQQGWVPQQPSPGQYGAGGFVQQQPVHTPPTQPYGASWDQQQAARMSQGRSGPIWAVRQPRKQGGVE